MHSDTRPVQNSFLKKQHQKEHSVLGNMVFINENHLAVSEYQNTEARYEYTTCQSF